jgi:hypothetical protein
LLLGGGRDNGRLGWMGLTGFVRGLFLGDGGLSRTWVYGFEGRYKWNGLLSRASGGLSLSTAGSRRDADSPFRDRERVGLRHGLWAGWSGRSANPLNFGIGGEAPQKEKRQGRSAIGERGAIYVDFLAVALLPRSARPGASPCEKRASREKREGLALLHARRACFSGLLLALLPRSANTGWGEAPKKRRSAN